MFLPAMGTTVLICEFKAMPHRLRNTDLEEAGLNKEDVREGQFGEDALALMPRSINFKRKAQIRRLVRFYHYSNVNCFSARIIFRVILKYSSSTTSYFPSSLISIAMCQTEKL